MKLNPTKIISTCIASLALLAATSSQAVNVTKLDTTSMAATVANWSAAPATTDVGEFTSTPSLTTLANLTLGGANLTLGGLQFDNNMNGPATILSGNSLILGTSGISLANANNNVTINCTVAPTDGAVQTWNVTSGRTLTLGAAISTGATSGTSKLTLNNGSSGTINFSGITFNQGGDGSYVIASGGTVSLGAFSIARTVNNSTAPTAASPVAAATGSGLVVNGATVSATTIAIGNGSRANSSASMLVSSGSLTASGAVTIGKLVNSGRWTVCQVSGGTFTVNDTTTGVLLSPNFTSSGPFANNSELYISGGTANLGKIQFGVSGDTLGGTSWVIVKGGNLYVGSGGVALANSSGSFIANFSIYSGLLGANADWSSSLAMSLSGPVGTPFAIQTADSGGTAKNITLSGVISGSGSLTKTGGGTLTLSGANTFVGNTAINAGTVVANVAEVASTSGPFGNPTTPAGSLTFGGGTLKYSANNSVDYSARFSTAGSQSISIDTAGRNVSFGSAIQGSATTLAVSDSSGTGSLTLAAIGNNYTGNTTINSGTLKVSGTLTGTGAVGVNSGGTLGGVGSLAGAVTVYSGGHLAPGSSVGQLTVGSLTLNVGSVNNFEFNSTPANDQTIVSTSDGLVINGGSFNLYAEGGTTAWITPGTYNLIQYSGAVSGSGTSGGDLDSTWKTASGSNPHIANPQTGYLYSFDLSGGWLRVTVASSVNNGTWGVDSDGIWSTAGNWTAIAGTMPPGSASDTATLGTGSSLRTVTLDSNESLGTLNFNNANSFVVATAGNTLTLDNSGSGAGINVTAGTANDIQTAVSLNDTTMVNVSSGKSLAVSGNISSTSTTKTITANGAGTLALSGNNNYGPASGTVGTTLSGGGTLQLGHNNALSTGDLNVSASGTIKAGGNVSVGNKILLGSGSTVTVDSASPNNLTLGGVISGTGGALTKTGNGTVTLSGANTYFNNTTVSAGTLKLGATGAIPNGGSTTGWLILDGAAGAAGVFDLNGFNQTVNALSGLSGTVLGQIVNNSGSGTSTLTVGGNTTSYAGLIEDNNNATSGQVALTLGGSAVLTLSGANTYSGGTTIGSGQTLKFGGTSAIGTGTLTINGGTLDSTVASLVNGGNNPQSWNGDFTFTGTQSLNLGSGAVTLGANRQVTVANTLTVGGAIGGAFSLTKAGGGTLVLGGNSTYTGGTTVSAGTVKLTSNTGAGTGNITATGQLQLGNGVFVTNGFTANQTFECMDVPDASAVAYVSGPVGNSGNGFRFNATGTGSTLIFSNATVSITSSGKTFWPTRGNIVYAGNTTINNNNNTQVTGLGRSSGNPATLTIKDNATLNCNGGFNMSIDSTANSSLAFTIQDSASVNLSTAAFNVLNAGISGVVLNLNGGTIAAGSITKGNATAETLNWNGTTIKANASSATFFQTLSGLTVNVGTGGAKVDNNGNAITIAQALVTGASPDGGLTSSGSGTNILTGNNTYNGGTVVNGGSLNINGINAIGGANYGGITLSNAATLQYAATLTSGSDLSLGNGITLGTAGASIDLNGNNVTYANAIGNSGGGSLTVKSTGTAATLTLNGANSYTGNTIIAGNSTLALAAGATISSSPQISVAAGAKFDVSASPIYALNGSGTLTLNLNKSGVTLTQGQVQATGLTAGGTLTITAGGDALTGGESFSLFNVQPSSTFGATNLPTLGTGLNWWTGDNFKTLFVNRAPTANDKSYTRGAGASVMILKSDLMAGASDPDSGDSASFDSLISVGSQGATIYTNATGYLYEPSNNNNDTLTFRVADGRGGSVVKNITITVDTSSNAGGTAQGITPTSAGMEVTFAGIPGFQYDVERATDVNFTENLVSPLVTTNAPGNGIFTITDGAPPSPTAYYRLKYNPN